MARRAGRNGSLYINLTSGGTPEPVAYLSSYTIEFNSNRYDVTAMGDVNMVYVAGLPDAQGSFDGFYDDASAQTFTAALDGVARKFYLYPDRQNTSSQYFWGTAFFDFSVDGSVDGPITVAGKWNAASAFTKVG